MDALKTRCFAQLCDVQYPSCLCESCSDPRHQADPAGQSSMGQADAEGLQLQLLVGFARALESVLVELCQEGFFPTASHPKSCMRVDAFLSIA